MALLALQSAPNGANLAFVAAGVGGDSALSGTTAGNWQLPTVLIVRNAAASPMDVTVAGKAPVTVAAGGAGVFPLNQTQKLNDLISITYSAVTSVTVAMARLYSV